MLDFIHVQDVARFFAMIALRPDSLDAGTYHLGTGIGTSIRQLARMIEQQTGKKLNADWGALPYRPLDVMKAVAPQNKQLNAVWQPKITLEQGLKEYVKN